MAMDTIYKWDFVTPPQISREEYEDVGASAFFLGDVQRAFKGSVDFEIWTAASGGSQLVEDTDYTLSSIDSDYSSDAGFNVHYNLTITNATYQTGSIFITYKILGSYVTAELLNDILSDIASIIPTTLLETDSDYVITDSDGHGKIVLIGAGANKTFTLPTLSDNQNRVITLYNSDTTYSLNVDGEGGETINGYTDIDLGISGDYITVLGTATEWKIVDTNFGVSDVDGDNKLTKIKNFTGTTDADTQTSVAHGIVDHDKILSASLLVFDSTSSAYSFNEILHADVTARRIFAYYDATNVIMNDVGTSLQGQSYKIKIEYYV